MLLKQKGVSILNDMLHRKKQELLRLYTFPDFQLYSPSSISLPFTKLIYYKLVLSLHGIKK